MSPWSRNFLSRVLCGKLSEKEVLAEANYFHGRYLSEVILARAMKTKKS